MTAPARITQADMDRATAAALKAARKVGAESARVIMRLEKSEIEIIIGEAVDSTADKNDFDED